MSNLPGWTWWAAIAVYLIGIDCHGRLMNWKPGRYFYWRWLWPIVTPLWLLTIPIRMFQQRRKSQQRTDVFTLCRPYEGPGRYKTEDGQYYINVLADKEPDRSQASPIPTGGPVPEWATKDDVAQIWKELERFRSIIHPKIKTLEEEWKIKAWLLDLDSEVGPKYVVRMDNKEWVCLPGFGGELDIYGPNPISHSALPSWKSVSYEGAKRIYRKIWARNNNARMDDALGSRGTSQVTSSGYSRNAKSKW